MFYFNAIRPSPVVLQAMIGRCSTCNFEAPTDKLETDEEGDWEYGYYLIHLCPKCDDGGCVDDYFPADAEEH